MAVSRAAIDMLRRLVLCWLLVSVCTSSAWSQQPSRSALEPQAENEQNLDAAANEPARYDEPPPPPVDYWNPTWLPCQSLRTNRSLVLGHLWFGMDIMGWSAKGVHAPALLTTSPVGTPVGQAGVIGGNTTVLFGDETLHDEMRPGGRLTIGWWFDPNQYHGVEWQYFELDGHDERFIASAGIFPNRAGDAILARPYVDANTGNNAAELVAYPLVRTGTIDIASVTQLTNTGILYRDMLWASEFSRVDYLVGYRHAHLADRLSIREDLTTLVAVGVPPNFIPANATILRLDSFRTTSQFDGADLGLRGWWSRSGTLALTSLAKVALGSSNRTVRIEGSTDVKVGNTTTSREGGVLAQLSNIGRYSKQDFSAVAELGLGLEWQPACFWKFSLGYTWFYWPDVVRALDHVDTTVDPDQIAPNNGIGGRPAFSMHTTSYWAQGLTAGFSYQF